jgi:hypothetical protein
MRSRFPEFKLLSQIPLFLDRFQNLGALEGFRHKVTLDEVPLTALNVGARARWDFCGQTLPAYREATILLGFVLY